MPTNGRIYVGFSLDFCKDLAYGLRSPRNATRGLQSVLQAFVLKYLLFDQRPRDQKSVPIEQ